MWRVFLLACLRAMSALMNFSVMNCSDASRMASIPLDVKRKLSPMSEAMLRTRRSNGDFGKMRWVVLDSLRISLVATVPLLYLLLPFTTTTSRCSEADAVVALDASPPESSPPSPARFFFFAGADLCFSCFLGATPLRLLTAVCFTLGILAWPNHAPGD